MIKVYDNIVPFHVQQFVYEFIVSSSFRIKGWEDRDDIEIEKSDLHSRWTLEDLKNSKLSSYINSVISNDDVFDKCIVNLTKPSDYYYTHTHGEDTSVVLYYANLEWRDGWAGETIFYDEQRVPTNAYEYTPGRLLKFSGDLPHSIRPQSFKAPQYRFTVSTFFKSQ